MILGAVFPPHVEPSKTTAYRLTNKHGNGERRCLVWHKVQIERSATTEDVAKGDGGYRQLER